MKLIRVALATLLAISLSLVVVTAASAEKYPGAVRKAFVSTCFKAAKKEAKGSVPNRKLKKACRVSLKCIERKLTVEEFSQADSSDRPVKKCIDEGAEAITG